MQTEGQESETPFFLRKKQKDRLAIKEYSKIFYGSKILVYYLTIRGGSLKNIAKNIIPSVPINKNVQTKASIKLFF